MGKSKKHGLLNKFLTKLYHMIDSDNTDSVSWSDDGLSFIIHDVARFADNVLPMYFKHSKFASFVRQLNFYSFRKMRKIEEDFRHPKPPSNNTVQFIHEFFRKGRPDMLHKITRVTKNQELPPTELKGIKKDIAELEQDIAQLSESFDKRIQAVKHAVEADYQQRLNSIALSYQTLSALSGQILVASNLSPPNAMVLSSISPLREDKQLHLPTGAPSAHLLSPKTENPSIAAGITADVIKSVYSDVPSISNPSDPKSSTIYVTDGSSTSSREDTAPNESVSPEQAAQHQKSALSLLSGIASAMIQEMEA